MIQSIAMMQKRSFVLAVAVLAGGCAANSTEQRIVDAAENIRTRKLPVDRIVLLHGTITPFADLVKTQGSSPTWMVPRCPPWW